jgi:hypothetical protein
VTVSALLDRGPHTVTIYLVETGTDTYGGEILRPSDTGVVISGCLLTPMGADRDATSYVSAQAGLREDRTWRFRARQAPLEPWGRVEWDDAGVVRRFTVISGPLRYAVTAATTHIAATLHEEN